MNARLAVVIPYFQREPGILAKAIASVFAQIGCVAPLVYIVDDESPAPSESELRGFDRSRIRLLKQSNRGAGAARNTALDALPDHIEYVAFLDSDDVWTNDHLRNAMSALEQGIDFYFTNHYQLDQTIGSFDRDERLNLREHRLLPDSDFIHVYSGDMFEQVILRNILGLSTNVYRFSKFRDLRFREELRLLGEDYCFWLDIARRGASFAFSTRCECRYEAGVNIYSGVQWGTEAAIVRAQNEILFWKWVAREYRLRSYQCDHLLNKTDRLREEFVLQILHIYRHHGTLPNRLLTRQLLQDPRTLLQLPLTVLHKVRSSLPFRH